MLMAPATKRVSSWVFAAAAKMTTESRPGTSFSRWMPMATAVRTLSGYCWFLTSACTCASLAPVEAKMAVALLMRSPGGVSNTVLLEMVMADMAMEYGTRMDVAVWMRNRPEKDTQAASV